MQESSFAQIKRCLSNVEETGPAAFHATCPVQDHEGCLFVSQEDTVIFRCEAGCSREEIVNAVDLKVEDLAGRSYRWASDITPSRVEWTWHPRIPRGYVTDLSGDPGTGKSFLTLALAAVMSRGIIPGEAEPTTSPGSSLLLTGEDHAESIVRPRLESMGADLERIAVVDEPFTLDSNGLSLLGRMVDDIAPEFVVIDPLASFVRQMRQAEEARAVMAGLATIAECNHCAVMVVRHLTKTTGGNPIHRSIGSIDFVASVRSALLAGGDPDDNGKRALVQVKSNVGPIADPIGYAVDDGRFVWTGSTEITANRLLEKSTVSRPAIDEAVEFLREELDDGSKPVNAIMTAAKEAGLSEKRVRSARERVCKRPQRVGGVGGEGHWEWELKD